MASRPADEIDEAPLDLFLRLRRVKLDFRHLPALRVVQPWKSKPNWRGSATLVPFDIVRW
jgi:hypothetical protein